jgi:hypothetical protein
MLNPLEGLNILAMSILLRTLIKRVPFYGCPVFIADISFIMEGPWYIAVKINHSGKTTTAKFNVNVP